MAADTFIRGHLRIAETLSVLNHHDATDRAYSLTRGAATTV